MNGIPIDQAKDRDLRLSLVAMQRAAQRARDLAHATGTAVVVSQNGIVEHLRPNQQAISAQNQPDD